MNMNFRKVNSGNADPANGRLGRYRVTIAVTCSVLAAALVVTAYLLTRAWHPASEQVLRLIPCGPETETIPSRWREVELLPPVSGAPGDADLPTDSDHESDFGPLVLTPNGVPRILRAEDAVLLMRCLEKAQRDCMRVAPVLPAENRMLLVDEGNQPIAYVGTFQGTRVMFIRSVIDYDNGTYSINQIQNRDLCFSQDPTLWQLIFNPPIEVAPKGISGDAPFKEKGILPSNRSNR